MASAAMNSGVACCAKCDQIVLRVSSRMTSEFPVMNFKIQHRTTGLASPAIAPQDLLAQKVFRMRWDQVVEAQHRV